jgi:hypothetical protein
MGPLGINRNEIKWENTGKWEKGLVPVLFSRLFLVNCKFIFNLILYDRKHVQA